MLSLCLIFSGLTYCVSSSNIYTSENKKIISKLTRTIEIPANSDYYIKFLSDNYTLEGKNIDPYSSRLSEKIKNAIAKSPKWIQRDLTRQLLSIDGEEYADLILEMDRRYVDEIAFTIAHSPIENVPPVNIIKDNVLILYKNDEWINYADIIDYDDNQGNYYSTVRYWVLENDTENQLEYPPDIYYWYIVHPNVISNAKYVYGKFWRDYLFNHNDFGYPLLKEKLSEIKYLWDCKSYSQPGYRLWEWSMENHPTAVEVISYWVGKTVPAQALGDRPTQPSIIAHEHNGWCGELKIIAVAAHSTALIPSVSANNAGEDHVWREFYERGWHQSDNWWADTGGVVDNPDIYAYSWGKDMSAIYAKKCDKSIFDLTSTYIHPEDSKTICFQVLDRRLKPVDGARVVVTVQGPKDITWLKFKLLGQIEKIWKFIPPLLKGPILQLLYSKITDRIESAPDIIDGNIFSIWNYTDMNGKCYFELGQNRSYLFIIQYGNLKSPFIPVRYNKLRILENPVDKNYYIILPLLTPIKDMHTDKDMPSGNIDLQMSFDSEFYQLQGELDGENKGLYEVDGNMEFFIVDDGNFNKYKNGESYICYNYINTKNGNINVSTQLKNWYIVFRNNGRKSNAILNFSVELMMQTTIDKVQIVSPDTDIFDNPIFNIGETVQISGVATDNIYLSINGLLYEVNIEDYEWGFTWNTSNLSPDNYSIIAKCGDSQDDIIVKLIDVTPPIINIDVPFNGEIINNDFLRVEGNAFDDQYLDKVEVAIDNGEWLKANGSEYWFIDLDLSNYGIGDYNISSRSFDIGGRVSYDEISFVINESGHNWSPIINDFYHQPNNPTNASNIVIYANVTVGSSFSIDRVVLFFDDGAQIKAKKMFMYANNPIQDRHVEDPLKNMSNEPIFGLELGQFETNTNITYWIQAFDTANNSIISSKKNLIIN